MKEETVVEKILSKSTRRIIHAICYFEITLNLIVGPLSMFYPALALQGMTNVDLSSSEHLIGLEGQRWFGVMIFVFGGVLFLRVKDEPVALKFLLEANLLGDILYAACLVPFALRFGKFPMIILPFLLTIIFFVARLVLYVYEDWTSLSLAKTLKDRIRKD
jgi:FtsH-binding integral membrane protein